MTITKHEIRKHLISLGIETPMAISNSFTDAPNRAVIANAVKDIMLELGLDLMNDSLKGTPARVAKMFIDEIFKGLDYGNFPDCTTVVNEFKYDQMIVVDEINVSSTCEHHLIVIDGNATVAYIPNKKVLGLSKINRIVDFFSRRPQIQERLTEQICATLKLICETEDVAVVIKAVHHCVKSRGIKDTNSYTVTSKLSGRFLAVPELRQEFFAVAHK